MAPALLPFYAVERGLSISSAHTAINTWFKGSADIDSKQKKSSEEYYTNTCPYVCMRILAVYSADKPILLHTQSLLRLRHLTLLDVNKPSNLPLI